MLHDELVAAKTTENGDNVSCAHTKDPCCRFDRQRRVLPQYRVERPSQVAKASSRKQIVPLVGEPFLERGHLVSSHIEKFPRGAGVI